MFALALPAWLLVVVAGVLGLVLGAKSKLGELLRGAMVVAGPVVLGVGLVGRALFHGLGARAGLSQGAVVGDICVDVPLTPVADQGAAWAAALVVWISAFTLAHALRIPKPTVLPHLRRGRAGRWLPASALAVAVVSLLATGPLEGPGCGFPAIQSLTELPRGLWNLGSRRSNAVPLPKPRERQKPK